MFTLSGTKVTMLLASLSMAAVASEVREPKMAMSKLPLNFEVNRGQADARVKYLSRVPGYNIYLTRKEAVLATRGRSRNVLRVRLTGAKGDTVFEPLDVLPGVSNYLIGNDPAKWRTNIPNYARVALRGVYPGVDLIFYGNQRQLEYDFVIAPGGDPDRIRVQFQGAKSIRADANGDLLVNCGDAEVRQRKPAVYQLVDGRQKPVDGDYVLRGRNEVAFRVAKYDRSRPLVIDPVLVYSSYLGGSLADQGNAIAVDSTGAAYVAGSTTSTNFPTASGVQTMYGGDMSDAFVTKINPQGSAIVYSTYLGGSAPDYAQGIAVDSGGNAYVTGYTFSPNFPTSHAFQPSYAGNADAFVTKLNAQGNGLVYSSYLGGTNQDVAYAIAVDSNGNTYVTGLTYGSFPVVNALQPTFGGPAPGSDAFVAKINSAGSGVIYATYLGGNNNDSGYGIVADSSGNAYIAGRTAGGFPVASAYQATFGGGGLDAFVTKISSTGSTMVFSTYLGGSGFDGASGIGLDANGNIYIVGFTTGGFPTQAAIQATYGANEDAFVAKFTAAGGLAYSTYLGGSGQDIGLGIAVDAGGTVGVTGVTASTNFPVSSAVQGTYGGGNSDVFVTKINAAGTGFLFSTYLGGAGDEIGFGIGADSSGNNIVTGDTTGSLPVANAFQPTFGGGATDAFVAKYSGTLDTTPPFGSFDTPVDGTNNVVGAVAVTGWALDNVGVTSLEIYRDPISGEPTGKFGLVFIGNANFVTGARPDVQSAYPSYPNANRAGWGYQLLTNFLPNSGNGTFKLHAFAYDAAGNVTELTNVPGQAPNTGRTITCTNASATKPFGTIDTPAQGGTASGNAFVNFGWALTPPPNGTNKIPTDGSTITVYIDGAPQPGHANYNNFRSDIANAFPNYTNSQGAVGYYTIDTTKLTNATHTIAWTVFDNAMRGEGIGSRFFTVANGTATGNEPEGVGSISEGRVRPIRVEGEPQGSKRTDSSVFLRRNATYGAGEHVARATDGSYSIIVPQMERIELDLGAVHDGYSLVDGERQALPVGSTLDPETGIFYWQIVSPFLGDYEFEFTPDDAGVPVRVRVRVVPQMFE